MRITKPTQRWFPAPDDPDKSEHLIRHLKPGEIMDTINESSTQETRYKFKKGTDTLIPEMMSTSTPGEASRKQFLLAVVNWKKMFDEAGKPLECNEQNKLRAMREIEGYLEFVMECRNTLAADLKKEEEARAKN